MEAALAGQTDTPYAQELPTLITDAVSGAGADPSMIVRQIVHLYRQVAERAALA